MHKPIATKFGMGDEFGHPYPFCKILSRSDKGFSLPTALLPTRANAYKVARLVNFLGFFIFSRAKPPAPIFTISMSNDVILCKDVFLGPETCFGSRKQNFTFRPHFPPKTQTFGQFLTGLRKFQVIKALQVTMAMHTC